MGTITEAEIKNHIETGLLPLHKKKLKNLKSLTLKEILERKNPYLFKAKHVTTAAEFINAVLGAFLSSQEETAFGGFLERLAIFICEKVFDGRKSSAKGIDLEFERDGIYYIVTIKSGPFWGNSGQLEKMLTNFRTAKRILGTNALTRNVVAVNGCMYGRDQPEDRNEYLKLCGQKFWEFISGNQNLYTDLIEPLGIRAKERREEFEEELARVTNRLTKEFLDEFCQTDGSIDWLKLVKFNASITPPAPRK